MSLDVVSLSLRCDGVLLLPFHGPLSSSWLLSMDMYVRASWWRLPLDVMVICNANPLFTPLQHEGGGSMVFSLLVVSG